MESMGPETATTTTTTIRVDTDARGAWSTIVGRAKDLMACPPADAYHRWLVDLVGLDNYQTDMATSAPQRRPELKSCGEPAPSHSPTFPPFPYFPRFPAEIRRKIFLHSVPAIVLQGKQIYPRHKRPMQCMKEANGILPLLIHSTDRTEELPAFMDRRYNNIALYSINRESRGIARTYYGTPTPHGLPFNPFKDSLRLEMDTLEDCLKYLWYTRGGDTWRPKLRNSWPEFKVLRTRPFGRRGNGTFSTPDPSLWQRIRSVTLSWLPNRNPLALPFGGGTDFKIAPIPFPWIKLLSWRFTQLRHITLEHAPLDDCVWADANQWPVGWIPADEERIQRPLDSSTGNRLYDISCLRVLDQLEKAIIDPSPTAHCQLNKDTGDVNVGATRPNEPTITEKRGLLPHLQSVTAISHEARCSHSKACNVRLDYQFPEHLSSEDRREHHRRWLTLYTMHRFLEIPAGTRPTAMGQAPWWPEEINDRDTDDSDDDLDLEDDSDSDPEDGEGNQGNFPDDDMDAESNTLE